MNKFFPFRILHSDFCTAVLRCFDGSDFYILFLGEPS
jgi:hypothetical protein